MQLSVKQVSALRFLSYKYGNGGSLSSADNHKFIQLCLQSSPSSFMLHRVTSDCRAAFDRILAGDYSELSESQRDIVGAIDSRLI